MNLLIDVDQNGDTELHRFVSKCCTFEELKDYILSSPQREIQKMARMENNQGYLPCELISLEADESESLRMTGMLLKLAAAHDYKPLSAPVNIQKSLTHYKVKPGTTLHANMLEAAQAANQVRQMFQESFTHPQTNHYSENKKKQIYNQIEILRKKAESKACSFQFSNFFGQFFNYHQNYISASAEEAVKVKTGNCMEIAFAVSQLLNDSELCSIEKGDHMFNLYGKGTDRVICDAWSGKVYPFYARRIELKNYRHFPDGADSINICTFYNENYHHLTPIRFENPNTSAYMTLSLFTAGVAAAISVAALVMSETNNLSK